MSPLWSEGLPLALSCVQERPAYFLWEGRRHVVEHVSRHWRVHLDWWSSSETWRDYWEVTTDTGLLCVLYEDLMRHTWLLERVHE